MPASRSNRVLTRPQLQLWPQHAAPPHASALPRPFCILKPACLCLMRPHHVPYTLVLSHLPLLAPNPNSCCRLAEPSPPAGPPPPSELINLYVPISFSSLLCARVPPHRPQRNPLLAAPAQAPKHPPACCMASLGAGARGSNRAPSSSFSARPAPFTATFCWHLALLPLRRHTLLNLAGKHFAMRLPPRFHGRAPSLAAPAGEALLPPASSFDL
jgi:hypothetical protein